MKQGNYINLEDLVEDAAYATSIAPLHVQPIVRRFLDEVLFGDEMSDLAVPPVMQRIREHVVTLLARMSARDYSYGIEMQTRRFRILEGQDTSSSQEQEIAHRVYDLCMELRERVLVANARVSSRLSKRPIRLDYMNDLSNQEYNVKLVLPLDAIEDESTLKMTRYLRED